MRNAVYTYKNMRAQFASVSILIVTALGVGFANPTTAPAYAEDTLVRVMEEDDNLFLTQSGDQWELWDKTRQSKILVVEVNPQTRKVAMSPLSTFPSNTELHLVVYGGSRQNYTAYMITKHSGRQVIDVTPIGSQELININFTSLEPQGDGGVL